MPKMLHRQKPGNKLECLYPSVSWRGRSEFMLHSHPRTFIAESNLMEKGVHFCVSVEDKVCMLLAYLYQHSGDSHGTKKRGWGEWPWWKTRGCDQEDPPHLLTWEHIDCQWFCMLSSRYCLTVHAIPRHWTVTDRGFPGQVYGGAWVWLGNNG